MNDDVLISYFNILDLMLPRHIVFVCAVMVTLVDTSALTTQCDVDVNSQNKTIIQQSVGTDSTLTGSCDWRCLIQFTLFCVDQNHKFASERFTISRALAGGIAKEARPMRPGP